MEQEHVDQRLDPGHIAAGLAGRGPERVVGRGECSGGAGLREGGGAGERAGLVPQHFEVVVQLDPGHATGAEARVGGEDGAALEHDHARGPQGHADALADEVRGDGVLDHADGDQGGAVDAGVEDQAGVEVVGRQRCQVGQLGVVVLPDRVGVAGDAADVVVVLPGADLVVEFVQGGDFGHGGEVVAAEPSDLALDAAFLVGAVDAGLAVERVEAVVGAEQHPAFVLVA